VKYKNAAERLPARLLEELRRVAPGKLLYVPAKSRQAWGEGTGARSFYERRNAEIRAQYRGGRADVPSLCDTYFLSEETVRKIIYEKGEIQLSEHEIDYSGYYWQNGLVRLRPSRPDDWKDGLAGMYDSANRFFTDGEQELPVDVDTWRERWENYIKDKRDGSTWVNVIAETHDGVKVGGGNLHGIDERNGTFGIFFGVNSEFRGKGYDLAAGRLLLDYAFNERRLHTCHDFVIEGDPVFTAFYEGLGFKKEGVLRAMVYHQGRYWDEVHYGLLAEEFNAARGIGDSGSGVGNERVNA